MNNLFIVDPIRPFQTFFPLFDARLYSLDDLFKLMRERCAGLLLKALMITKNNIGPVDFLNNECQVLILSFYHFFKFISNIQLHRFPYN